MDMKFFRQQFLVGEDVLARWNEASQAKRRLYLRFLTWLCEKTNFDIYTTGKDNGTIFFGVYGNVQASYRLGWIRIDAGAVRVRLKSRLYDGVIIPKSMTESGGKKAKDDKGKVHYDFDLTVGNVGRITELIMRCMGKFEEKLSEGAERVLPATAVEGEDFTPSRTGRKFVVLTGDEIEVIAKLRVGQRGFRAALLKRWGGCSVTKVAEKQLLVASHIKPWRTSKPDEKVDVDNGFLLTPALDRAFDALLISFSKGGNILLKQKHASALEVLGITKDMALRMPLNEKQAKYLEWHRKAFKKAA